MATTEELLAQLENNPEMYAEESQELVIDAETRTINIPASETLFGVKGDKNIERKYFRCPRIVGDNVDLSTHLIYIAYVYTESNSGSIFPSIGIQPYHCDDVEVDGDDITFSWKLSDHVFQSAGFIAFKMYAKEKEDSPYTVFNTAPAIGTVLYTIGDGVESVVSENPDIINQLLVKMESVQEIATPEAMQGYVNAYLEENPVQGGITEEQKQQLEQNTQDITDLKSALSKTNFGWTNQQIVLLQSLFDYLVYSDQETGQSIADSLIYSLKNNTEIPDEPEEPENPEEIYYNIMYSLENVTSDNNETRIKKGESYIANLSPSSGYYINSVTITMGGENITSTVYLNGVINISSVNGEIMILAKGAESDNLIKLSECTSDERMPDGSAVTEGEMLVTPLIKVTPNTIYKTNISKYLSDSSETYDQKIFAYNDLQVFMRADQLSRNVPYQTITDVSIKEGEYYVRILFSVKNENPYFGISGVIV